MRDRGLFHSVTDNGAGGLSCSVGEMARESGGCEVDLERIPIKYPGLAPWEVWVSESQERMTYAVSPDKLNEFMALAKKHDAEATVIGKFTDSGRCVVRLNGKTIVDMDLDFLHDGLPQLHLHSEYKEPKNEEPAIKNIAGGELTRVMTDMASGSTSARTNTSRASTTTKCRAGR